LSDICVHIRLSNFKLSVSGKSISVESDDE
jgi:hypothetical protein